MEAKKLLGMIDFHAKTAKGMLTNLEGICRNNPDVKDQVETLLECYRSIYSSVRDISKSDRRAELEAELQNI